ncbi:MAG: MlaE family lipid ABC transporter permease subunit [Bradymonadaceae bacterium]
MSDVAVDRDAASQTATVRPRGALNVHSVPELYAALGKLVEERGIKRIVVDFSGVESVDSSAIAAFSVIKSASMAAEKTLVVEAMNPDTRQAFGLMGQKVEIKSEEAEPFHPLEWIGARMVELWREAERFYELLTDTVFVFLGALRGRLPPRGAFTDQAVAIGVQGLPIVALLSFLLGLIMAFQAAYQLRQFGANIFVADLVGISMVREFGPIITAIILAGRTGSAIAAELGTMVVQEEIDALKTMGIDPNRYLLMPRLAALSIVQPALTLLANLVGILGGFLIGVYYLDLSASAYINQTISALTMGDLLHGLLKSLVFAWIIGIISCYCGFSISGGASGVGRATTRAVVASIFLIIVADSIFTTAATLL